jgi:hypothetical protein
MKTIKFNYPGYAQHIEMPGTMRKKGAFMIIKPAYLILFATFILMVGCTPKKTVWQYHVEHFESDAHAERASLLGYAEKRTAAERNLRLSINEEAAGSFLVGNKLDELGKQGWEMVSCFVEPETVWPNLNHGQSEPVNQHPNVRGAYLVAIFKRPL